ncbi:PIG-L family deacetylase [Saccharopolyspora sp. NPDC000995]
MIPQRRLGGQPCLLVVVAHPDDAEIGMAMRMRWYALNDARVRVHCLTTGTPTGDGTRPLERGVGVKKGAGPAVGQPRQLGVRAGFAGAEDLAGAGAAPGEERRGRRRAVPASQ